MRHNNLSENNRVEDYNSNSDQGDVTTHIQRNNDYDLAKIRKDEPVTVESLVENPGVSTISDLSFTRTEPAASITFSLRYSPSIPNQN